MAAMPLVNPVDEQGEQPEWFAYALCAQADPDAFYPEKGGTTREAKRICQVCPARPECLEYALARNERFGIWGGLSERERRLLRRGRQPRPAEDGTAVNLIRPLVAGRYAVTSDDIRRRAIRPRGDLFGIDTVRLALRELGYRPDGHGYWIKK